MATYAIGDVHGCFRTLRRLFDDLPFDRASDHLWLVGDLVNRGPRSLKVLRWVRELEGTLGERLVVVLGNHDVHLLAVAAGLGKPQHREFLADVLEAPDGEEMVAWLASRPLLHHEGDRILVHAGLLPEWDLESAARRARRSEEILRGPEGLRTLLGGGAEGSESPIARRERETFRVLTRIRTVRPDGELCDHTGPPESAPEGCRPWFDVPGRRTRNRVVVAGHWAALGRRLRPDLVALDSGCVYGGTLSAVRLEDRALFERPNCE